MTDWSCMIPFARIGTAEEIGWKQTEQQISSPRQEKVKVGSKKKSKRRIVEVIATPTRNNNKSSDEEEEECDSYDNNIEESVVIGNDDHDALLHSDVEHADENDRIAPGVTITSTNTNMSTSIIQDNDNGCSRSIELNLQGDDATVTIYGRYKLIVKEGEICVLGYRMISGSPSVIIESPKWLGAIVIQNTYNTNNSNVVINNSHHGSSEGITTTTTNNTSLILITSLKNDAPHNNDETTNKSSNKSSLKRRRMDCYHGLYILDPSRIKTIIQIPTSWQQSVNLCVKDVIDRRRQIITDDEDIIWMDRPIRKKQQHPPPKILICGAKGVGKSTLLRYTVNQILSCCNDNKDDGTTTTTTRVAILDCDVGQPEFSPPGLVSLTIVSQPILTPPHCHMMYGSEKKQQQQQQQQQQKSNNQDGHDEDATSVNNYCERAYYFGHTTSKADPHTYLHFVSNLMDAYRKLSQLISDDDQQYPLPLIVNCDGWVKSMGREILATIINDIVHPDHIIQIVGPSKSTSFGLPIAAVDQENMNCVHYNPRVHIVEIFGTQEHQQQQQHNTNRPMLAPAVRPKELRSLRLCSYFVGGPMELARLGIQFTDHAANTVIQQSSSILISKHLAAMIPYRVPFDSIQCRVIDSTTGTTTYSDEMLFDCMDGTIVGLGVDNGDDPAALPCVGLGIVRSMDRKGRILYILTPIPLHQLQHVTVLFIGGSQIVLPIECLMPTEMSEAFPFLQICNNNNTSPVLGDDWFHTN